MKITKITGPGVNTIYAIGDAQYVAQTLAEREEFPTSSLIFNEIPSLPLDPGGMLNMKENNLCNFEVEGIQIETFWDKLGAVLDRLKNAEEWIPGYLGFTQFGSIVTFPSELAEKFQDKLLMLNFSDEANARVAENKAMRRWLMELGMLAEPDENGVYRTGPGSSKLIK